MAINIAIIDDGINTGLYNIASLENDIEITPELNIIERADYDIFLPSHGTTCAAIIKKYAPNAKLSSIKILNDNAKGLRAQLVKALEWCTENNMHLLNMSLGTIDFRDVEIVKEAVDAAIQKGIVIVAAANNRNVYTCPASLEHVIGVKCDLTDNLKAGEFVWNSFAPDGIDITSCSIHELVKHTGEVRTTSPCNSFATPMITATVHQIMEEKSTTSLYEIKKDLKIRAVSRKTKVYNVIEHNPNGFEMDVPIIVLFDALPKSAANASATLASSFKSDGYNAVAVQPHKSPEQSIVSIADYCKDDMCDMFEGIKSIYTVHDPDILIVAIDNLEKIAELEKSFEIDIKVFMENSEEDTLEQVLESNINSKLIILSPENKGASNENIRILRDNKTSELYKCIIELFENDTENNNFILGVN